MTSARDIPWWPNTFGPQRIVCLTEETTEWLYLLGQEQRIAPFDLRHDPRGIRVGVVVYGDFVPLQPGKGARSAQDIGVVVYDGDFHVDLFIGCGERQA